MTATDLREEGFSPEIIEAVETLTKRDGEIYEDFICRAASKPLARRVKIADLEDNMDFSRLSDISDADCERMKKYKAAYRVLTDEAD